MACFLVKIKPPIHRISKISKIYDTTKYSPVAHNFSLTAKSRDAYPTQAGVLRPGLTAPLQRRHPTAPTTNRTRPKGSSAHLSSQSQPAVFRQEFSEAAPSLSVDWQLRNKPKQNVKEGGRGQIDQKGMISVIHRPQPNLDKPAVNCFGDMTSRSPNAAWICPDFRLRGISLRSSLHPSFKSRDTAEHSTTMS